MKILALDSSAKTASVAVTDGDRLLGLYSIENGLTQSELLLPMIENMLAALQLEYSDIELFAVSRGPGSFTGVRIGAALIKGIAFGRDVPCVGVSTLEALAENASVLDGITVPVMDARREQFYSAIFKNGKRLTEDMAISADALAEKLKEFDGKKIYLVGDGYKLATKLLLQRGIVLSETPALLRSQSAYSVALSAKRHFEANEAVSDSELLPSYLRPSQAERERLERESTEIK